MDTFARWIWTNTRWERASKRVLYRPGIWFRSFWRVHWFEILWRPHRLCLRQLKIGSLRFQGLRFWFWWESMAGRKPSGTCLAHWTDCGVPKLKKIYHSLINVNIMKSLFWWNKYLMANYSSIINLLLARLCWSTQWSQKDKHHKVEKISTKQVSDRNG